MKHVRKKQDKKTDRDINDLDNKIREQVKVYYASDSLYEKMRDFVVLTILLINCKFALINFNLHELEAEIENVFKMLGLTSAKGE